MLRLEDHFNMPPAASRFRDRAFEFLRRGEKNRSSAFQSTQIDRTTEFALSRRLTLILALPQIRWSAESARDGHVWRATVHRRLADAVAATPAE
jgi:hypothetical protein